MGSTRLRWLLCGALLCSVATLPSTEAGRERPLRFLAGTDSEMVQIDNAQTGQVWAAWTYRNGGETDVALSVRGKDGFWSEPQLIGLDDRENQRQPALAVDVWGTVYLTWAEQRQGRVLFSRHGVKDADWSEPVVVSVHRASHPALLIVAQRRVIVAFREGERVRAVEFDVEAPKPTGQMNDGPDVTGNERPQDELPPDSDDDDLEDVPITGEVQLGGGRKPKND